MSQAKLTVHEEQRLLEGMHLQGKNWPEIAAQSMTTVIASRLPLLSLMSTVCAYAQETIAMLSICSVASESSID